MLFNNQEIHPTGTLLLTLQQQRSPPLFIYLFINWLRNDAKSRIRVHVGSICKMVSASHKILEHIIVWLNAKGGDHTYVYANWYNIIVLAIIAMLTTQGWNRARRMALVCLVSSMDMKLTGTKSLTIQQIEGAIRRSNFVTLDLVSTKWAKLPAIYSAYDPCNLDHCYMTLQLLGIASKSSIYVRTLVPTHNSRRFQPFFVPWKICQLRPGPKRVPNWKTSNRYIFSIL